MGPFPLRLWFSFSGTQRQSSGVGIPASVWEISLIGVCVRRCDRCVYHSIWGRHEVVIAHVAFVAFELNKHVSGTLQYNTFSSRSKPFPPFSINNCKITVTTVSDWCLLIIIRLAASVAQFVSRSSDCRHKHKSAPCRFRFPSYCGTWTSSSPFCH